MTTEYEINQLLNDKLFQVIGSTPRSIAENLMKIDLRKKAREGAQIFAVSIFASAVNKATLESFLADSRFAAIRPLITAALSIKGNANMTALTLLGHCFLTTDVASNVEFAKEFRKKMGQDHLWAGELDSGSLSEQQKKILKEKKRVTKDTEAKALGNGFLKHVGIVKTPMSTLEADMFGGSVTVPGSSPASASRVASPPASDRGKAPVTPAVQRTYVSPTASPGTEVVTLTDETQVSVPEDVLTYRRNVLGQSNADIAESLRRRGVDGFIASTRQLIEQDPDGTKTRAASAVRR